MIRKFAKIFNNFFSNVVSDLKYLTTVIIFHEKKHILSQLLLKRLKNTPVFLILSKGIHYSVFSFRKTTQEKVSKVIGDLNTKKSQTSDTPTKIIKLNSGIFSNLICKHFNYSVDKGAFPNDLKYGDIVSVYKKIAMRKTKL